MLKCTQSTPKTNTYNSTKMDLLQSKPMQQVKLGIHKFHQFLSRTSTMESMLYIVCLDDFN